MKTKNILAIVSFFIALVMTSCSADGVLDDMSNQNIPTSPDVVALACNVRAGVETRAAEEGTDGWQTAENSTKDAFFFLIKEGKVLEMAAVGNTIYTKAQAGLSVMVVTGVTGETLGSLKGATEVETINKVVLNATDLANFIKVGTSIVDFTGATKDEVKTIEVNVTVNQVAARVDLQSLTITGIAADKVTLKSIRLKNRHMNGLLNGVSTGTDYADGELKETNKADITAGYTFANAEGASKKVTLELVFNVDGDDVPVSVTIKHNGVEKVEANYIYKLNLKATITGKNIVPTVTFEVAPWNTSSIITDMEDITTPEI